MVEKETKGEELKETTMDYLVKKALNSPKHYFAAVNFGYLIAIICTIVVMLVFDHGQPALLYLVPGCILTVLGTAAMKGEVSELFKFDENLWITAEGDEDEDDDNKKDK